MNDCPSIVQPPEPGGHLAWRRVVLVAVFTAGAILSAVGLLGASVIYALSQDSSDIVTPIVGVSFALLPLAGMTVGAILLLKMRSQGRSILAIYYWVMLGVSLITSLAVLTTREFSQNTGAWIVAALLLATAILAIVALYFLHSASLRNGMSRHGALTGWWLTAICVSPAFIVGIPLGLIAGIASGSNLMVAIVRPNFDRVGGLRLVYQIDPDERVTPDEIDKMVRAVSLRVDPARTAGARVAAISSDQIEISLPLLTDPHQIELVKSRISQLGQLEFQVLANEKHDGESGNHAISRARELLTQRGDLQVALGTQLYQWRIIHDPDRFDDKGSSPGEGVAVENGYVLTLVPDEQSKLTGYEILRSEPSQDRSFRPAVGFHLDASGSRNFARLTRTYQPEADGFRYRLAIILDGRVMSAPVINSPITNGDGIIEGNFTAAEVANLVAVLNAGKLPHRLLPDPVAEAHVPPKK